MKTKRILAAILALNVIICAASCNKEDSQSSMPTQTTSQTAAITTVTEQSSISQEIVEQRDNFEFSEEIQSGDLSDTISWKLDEYGLLVISGTEDMPDFTAQTEVPWYDYCEDIEYLHIENGITSIGNAVFCGCVNLKEIKNEAQIIKIGNYAFQNCYSLKSVDIGDSLEKIGISTFENCYYLENAVLGVNITEIGKCAFKDCVALENAPDLSNVTRIEDFVFSGCSLMQFGDISSETEYIGTGAFEECGMLNAIAIPEKITAISESAFAGAGLTTLEIPNHVTDIGIAAFAGCKKLESITFNEGLQDIGMGAFSGCILLTKAELPLSIEFIDSNVFARCTSLTEIQISEDNPNYTCVDGVLYTESQRTLKQYPLAKPGDEFEIISSITAIEPGALQGALNLAQITVDPANWSYTAADGVLYSGYFEEIICCPPKNPVEEFIAPEDVSMIGIYAFYGCENLKSVQFGEYLENVKACAFLDCINLETVILPQTVLEIGKNVFDNTKVSGEFEFNEGIKYYESSFPDDCTVTIIPNTDETT